MYKLFNKRMYDIIIAFYYNDSFFEFLTFSTFQHNMLNELTASFS